MSEKTRTATAKEAARRVLEKHRKTLSHAGENPLSALGWETGDGGIEFETVFAELVTEAIGIHDAATRIDPRDAEHLVQIAEHGLANELGQVDVRNHYTEEETRSMSERWSGARRAIDAVKSLAERTAAAEAETPQSITDAASRYAEHFALNDDVDAMERELLSAFREVVALQRSAAATAPGERVMVPLDVTSAREAIEALDAAASGDSNDREIDAGREVADILVGVLDDAQAVPSVQTLIADALHDRGEGAGDEQALVAAEQFRQVDEDDVWTTYLGPLLDELTEEYGGE